MAYTPKILIVDDRRENLFALENVLQESGAEIIKALSGNDALKATLEHEFAVAILDVQMPEMDGYELAELLRSQKVTHHLPIIFMSAVYSSDYHVFKGYDTGAVDFIVKPYNPKVLHSKVNVFLQLAHNMQRLQESQERFRTLVMTIPDIVYRIDRDGRFTFVNDAVKRLGYDPRQIIGKPFSDIVFPPDVENVSRCTVLPKYEGKKTGHEEAPKLFDERRTGKRKTTGLEIRLAAKSRSEPQPGRLQPISHETIVVEVNSSGMYQVNPQTKGKVFIGTVGVIRDITERKRAEDAHREALLKERLKVLMQMAGATAHEMNQPLTELIGNIDLLALDKDDPDALQELIENIRDAGKRIAETVYKIQNLRHYATKSYAGSTTIIDIDQENVKLET